ncbi:unnamed protein product [Mytilus coruscus]|uniref:SORBS1 n=1 Tax=Mytilus coruscus TaxID=42192 RepID=A0A6J8AJM7_MYTCO|nr:unnamed protein product [Mytilus coruscus]
MSYTVTLKGGSPWGFRFQGGCDFNEPIKIAKINPNSKAYKEGIKVGDYIESINGQKTEGLLHNDVQQIIKCANKELTLDLRSCKSPMMNGQINGDIHPIEAQIISGIFRATPHYIQPQRKTTADVLQTHYIIFMKRSHHLLIVLHLGVFVFLQGSHSVPSSPRFQSKLNVPITSPKPLRHRDAAWDRSSPSPSLWSTTSCYTSDSAKSTPQTSPAIRRRQPPKPLPKPMTTGRSRRQIFEHSSSLGSSARSLVSPNRSLGSPSRSISPATSDHSSKGMQMFLRQMEKLSRYSDDEDKGVSDSTSSTLTAHSLAQEDHQLPIMKEEVAVEEQIIPISVKRERMIPLTIQTSAPDLRNFPQEETRSRDSGITSRGSSWQSGCFKDGNFSPGSYYTLPVRKSSSEKVTDKQNEDFDYSKCTTLPTIKPLKTQRGYESDMNYDGRGRGDIQVRSQRKPIVVPHDGYNTDVDYNGRGRGDMRIRSQRKPIVPQDGYSTDVDFCVRNNHRNNQAYSHGRQYNQRDYIHDMDLDSVKLPQKAKLYDQRGFVSEVDLSSFDSQPDLNRYRQWPPQPQAQPQYNPPQQVDSNLPRRHSETVQSPSKYVSPSRQERPNYTKWTPKSSPSAVRRQGSLDSSSSSPNRGRYIPIKVVHEESRQQPDVDHRVGQKNEDERPSHEVPPAMNGTHISTEYSPSTNIESHYEPASPQRTVVHTESKPVISNVAPVWNPKKGAIFQKKEYKPIKLDTLRKTSMEIQKQHVENQKQEELNIIPPPPEDSYSCQQPEKEELHEYKSFVSYTPQTSTSETAPAEPSRTEWAPYQPKTEFVDYTFSNGQFDEEPSRLPPTQSPFVTLLRKGRENGFPVDLKDIKNVTEPLVIDTEGQIPKGALYIGEQALVQDGLKHTDTYYAVPTTEEEDMSQQSPTSPSEKKPLKYDGIGPTDDGGMPLSFRMNVDEKNQHQWYKQMYKSLHTSKKKEGETSEVTETDSNSYRPTYEFPEVKTEPKPKEDTKKPVVEETVTKENPYKPAYELPSTHREDSSKFRVNEKNKQNGRLSSSQTEKITKSDFNQRKEQFTGKKDVDAGYRSEPDNSSKTKSRSKSLSDFKADFKSSTKPKSLDTEISEEVQDFLNYLDEWNPPNARSTVEKYRCQPRSIVDYEPGFSSIAFQEAKTGPGRYRSNSATSPTERKKKTDSTKGAAHNPPIDKPGQFSRYTEGAHTRLASGAGDNSDEAANQADLYKLVQQGGDIPIRGLQKPGPEKSGSRSTAHLEVTGGRISKLKTDQNPKQIDQCSSAGYKREKCNVIPVRSPASAGDAQSMVSGFSGFQPELHSTPKSSIVDSHRPIQQLCGKPDLLNSAPNQSHTNYLQNDKTKLGLINTGQCNVSSLIENRHKCDKDLIESPKKQNNNMDYHTMTENVRKFAGSPSAFPESKVTQNMENKEWDNLLEDEHKGYDRPPSRAKLSRSARGSVSSEKSSRLDSHTYQSYTAGLLHSTSRSEKFLNLQKNYAMLERISEIEEKVEKPIRPNSMDPQTFQDMFDIVNTSRQEELDELYFELEEAKRNREFFSSVKSQTWDPSRDYSLTRKEKSVGDLKALYAGLENSSKEKPVLSKAKSLESTYVAGQSNECFNSPLQEKVYIQSPQRSPRGTRAIHGTSIEPLANKYEIYVEKKQKEYKDTPNNEELHVRSVSVPVNELESPKPLKRAHSSIGNKMVTTVDSKIYVKEPELSIKPEKTQIRHGGKVIAMYVNDSVQGVNFRNRTNSNGDSQVNTNIKDNSGINSPRTNSPLHHKSRKSDKYERIRDDETNVFHRHFGEKCVLDERDKLPLQKDNAMKSCSHDKIHNLEEPQPNANLSQSPVQFRVRNLRVLAENNEFSDSKFAKMRPISDSVSPSGFESMPLSFGTNEKETGLDSADDYVRLKKWRTSDLCENDGTNSENSSTDTFIVKSSEDELEKDGENLPDVTKGTKSNSKQNEEPVFEKSKSEPDLKQGIRKEPVRPRSAKSHIKLNEPVNGNKLPSNFGMPRTVSGNLREVFKQYKHEGKFSRFQAPEHKTDSLKSQTLPRTSRVSKRRYDAYIPPSHIMKEVARESDQYKRTEPIHKERTPSSASKMTVQYLDLIGNEWSQERNKQSIVNSPRSHSQGHRRDGDYVQLNENDHLSDLKIKSASLGRHPKKQDYPEFYYHTWSPQSPSGHYNQKPKSPGQETRSHRNQPPPNPRHRTNPSNSEKVQQQQQQSPLSPLPPKVPPPPKLSPRQPPIIKSSTSYNQLYSKFESGQQGNSYTNRFGNDPPAPPVRSGNFHEPPNPPVRKLKSAPVSKLRIRSNLSAAEQLGIKSSSPKLNGVDFDEDAFKFQTSDVRRSPTERVQRRREDEEEYRRKRLEQIYEEERRRKIELEKADIEARKHSDFFTAAQKSPIPADRFEEPISGYNTVPADRRRGFKIHGKAKAVYNFNAQNPRELSFRKGDIIYLLRQIDKNWFEGERYGRSGLFPVNYVEGDIVTLLRSVDENWYEGRVGNKQGIFPRSYVEVIFDPSTPLVTPAPSVITTPMTGTPEMLSPSGYDAPTPPPQPSPRAFSPRSSAFQHHQQRQFSPQQQGISPHQQTLSPQQQGISPHQQTFSPQQQGLSPHQQTFSAQQQGLSSHQQAFNPQRSNYTSPRYDGPQQRMDDGPVRLNGYSQYNGDYNVSPQHQGQQQGRPRQSPTMGRKQFVSNGPTYPPSANINYNVETNNNEIRNKVPDDDLALCRYRAVFAYRPQNDDELELLEGDEVYVMERCDDGWKLCTINSMTNQNLL